MTLHTISQNNQLAGLGLRWYTTYVWQQGRRHLFWTPEIRIQPEDVRLPAWYDTYTPERRRQYQEQLAAKVFLPARFDPNNPEIQRFKCCNVVQPGVNHYELYYGHPSARRGFCKKCYKLWEALDDEAQARQTTRWSNVHGVHSLATTVDSWAAYIRTHTLNL